MYENRAHVCLLSLPNTRIVTLTPFLIELIQCSCIEVLRVDYGKLSVDRLGESSEAIRKRVQTARDFQQTCFSKLDSKHPIFCNADMDMGKGSF